MGLQETDRLYQIWDALHNAGSECYYVTVRRQALRAPPQGAGAGALRLRGVAPARAGLAHRGPVIQEALGTKKCP